MWLVQVSKGKGSYRTKYALETEGQALVWYHGINNFGPYNKRLVAPDGRVVQRQMGWEN